MVEPSQQVVAGLLQQHVVVPLVGAVGVVVIAEVPQTIHCRREEGVKNMSLGRVNVHDISYPSDISVYCSMP